MIRDTVVLDPPIPIPENYGDGFKHNISVDAELADEIMSLWNAGVLTCGCCAGHDVNPPWIAVREESIDMMKQLGYRSWPTRPDFFFPKEVDHGNE